MTDALIWQTQLVPNRKRSFSTWQLPWPPSSLIQPPKFCPWRPRRLTTPSRCFTFLRCRSSPTFPASTSTSRGLTASTSPSTEDTTASETTEERPIYSGKVQFFTCFIKYAYYFLAMALLVCYTYFLELRIKALNFLNQEHSELFDPNIKITVLVITFY